MAMRSRGASIFIEPCHPRLPVENRARLATAPPGIANDIKEKSAPEDGRPTRSKPKSRAHANGDSMLPTLGALGLSRLPGPPLRTSRLPSVELPALVRAAGWLDSREDLAVVWWQLHRLKVTFAAAYDVESYAHAKRERLSVATGLLLGHNAT